MFLSVIVHDFYVVRVSISPYEANPPLIVYANAVLPLPIALQGFQAVLGRNAQIFQSRCNIKQAKLACSHSLEVYEAGNSITLMQCFCVAAFE